MAAVTTDRRVILTRMRETVYVHLHDGTLEFVTEIGTHSTTATNYTVPTFRDPEYEGTYEMTLPTSPEVPYEPRIKKQAQWKREIGRGRRL